MPGLTRLAIELTAMFENIRPGSPDAMQQLVDLQSFVDIAEESKVITLTEWRTLMEKTLDLKNRLFVGEQSAVKE